MRFMHDRFVLSRRTGVRVACLLPALVLLASVVDARVYLSRDEALRVAFGDDADVARTAVFLTDNQLELARARAGEQVEIKSALVTLWVGTRGGQPLGTVYFDTHRVRTLEETIMVVVEPGGTIERIEILAFHEPEDYLPREIWLQQFDGRTLDRDLSVKRGIHGITGATLSAKAVTDAARRILAIHQVVAGDEPADGNPEGP
jgi:hypothetical protein